jgi:hypothetical protein
VEKLINPRIITRKAEVSRLNAQGFADREKRIKDKLLGNHTKAAFGIDGLGRHVPTKDPSLTRRGAHKARKNLDKRGFARAIGTQKPKEFALCNP